jgi:undecaprenyl-diphosphatase
LTTKPPRPGNSLAAIIATDILSKGGKMTFWQGLVLGAVQGIAEWLPVSSEGINTLILLNFFQKTPAEAVLISIWLHTGTVLAALVYFRKDVMAILGNLPQYFKRLGTGNRSEWDTITTFLIIASLLTGIIGAPMIILGLNQEEVLTDNLITLTAGFTVTFTLASIAMAVIGIFLIVTGLLQKYAARVSGNKTRVGVKDAILLGVVQAFSVLPGLSRSGLTVSALLFRGCEAKYAIRLSFLMSIPVLLAAVVGLGVIGGVDFSPAYLGSTAAAFLFGILTVGALLKIANRIQFWKFCFILGGLSFLPLVIENL